MAPAAAPIRDLLTSFSPAADFVALSSGDGRIKVWDAVRGHLQTEFADIPAVEASALPGAKRGHLALDYTCMKGMAAVPFSTHGGVCTQQVLMAWSVRLMPQMGRFREISIFFKSNICVGSVIRYAATEDLLKLSGHLRLIMAQVDKDASDVSEPPSEEMQDAAAAPSEEEEEDEEIDEMVYGEDADSS